MESFEFKICSFLVHGKPVLGKEILRFVLWGGVFDTFFIIFVKKVTVLVSSAWFS